MQVAAEYGDEFAGLAADRTDNGRFYLRNDAFGGIDPFVLWTFVRESKPKNVIEVGSGFSTLLINEAMARNCDENVAHRGIHTIIDPYPREFITEDQSLYVIRERVQDVDPDLFGTLDAGDILFVDSSHIHADPDSDVRFEISEIYPRLKHEVHVHVHDVYLPWHYPQEIILDERRPFNEQYMLQPFLSNPSVAISFSSYYALREYPELVWSCTARARSDRRSPDS
jgi:hypothetical protein